MNLDGQTSQPHCPSCGNGLLLEFFHPSGVALCPRCGCLLQRSVEGLAPIGFTTETVARLVHGRVHGDDILRERIQQKITDIVAARLGIERSAVADSLDMVELVMALEEEFGVELDGH